MTWGGLDEMREEIKAAQMRKLEALPERRREGTLDFDEEEHKELLEFVCPRIVEVTDEAETCSVKQARGDVRGRQAR